MPSISRLLSFVTGLLTQAPLYEPSNLSGPSTTSTPPDAYRMSAPPACPVNGPVSCHNASVAPDSCCFVYPGGQLLQTQFWDTAPAVGPAESWTLHGLWPDRCDGSYPSYCDAAPRYANVSALVAARDPHLLGYMTEYWRPNAGSLEHFWQHEWNKHGTCVNTLAPACYGPQYRPGDELVDFFATAVELFRALDTYAALADAGILPDPHRTYDNDDIQRALTRVTGGQVVLGCSRGALNQAWYSFNVRGSLQDGDFVATDPAGKSLRGTCPRTGIRYLPK